ncbi:hypothetical protein ADK53_07540 [Streptomyces sp. WM6373]|uniref:hypothetical protein n=1 Tax=unclassified Streptomyces TaxID=2593676 RepID=UPI0006ADD1A5|nr:MULTISPECIES: hypothetical protein [unclassified Streptomyces]KOU42460.1 hypothetical protein ADK53_07540 [Streptomyces sp. WM6373]KOU78596.1 hypothetical protein ADK61_12475 [Streptomyces sp. XY66]KOV21983.1 hypothetical protein ADK90_11445 [Streptomyces sp. XY413]KOV32904.1 hypothetical protein ADK97_20945 [Streptomyces sp. H021]
MDYELQRTLVSLEEIASGDRELRAVRHPLGFLCLPLLREGLRGICVHLFEADNRAEPDASPLHAHSWELRSRVLYGRVANVPVRTRVVRDGEDGATHRVFEVHSRSDGVDEIRPTPLLVRSEPGPAHISSGGETYTLPAGEFHATALEGPEPAATLVHGLSVPGRRDLSLGPLDGRPRRTTRRLCDKAQTVRSVHTVLRRLDAQQRA